jgi:hypothetical protein
MANPIFFSSLLKRYVVEIREAGMSWRVYGRYRRLEEAAKARRAAVKDLEVEARIVNRVTGEVVRNG